jgi:hypothetical protein
MASRPSCAHTFTPGACAGLFADVHSQRLSEGTSVAWPLLLPKQSALATTKAPLKISQISRAARANTTTPACNLTPRSIVHVGRPSARAALDASNPRAANLARIRSGHGVIPQKLMG